MSPDPYCASGPSAVPFGEDFLLPPAAGVAARPAAAADPPAVLRKLFREVCSVGRSSLSTAVRRGGPVGLGEMPREGGTERLLARADADHRQAARVEQSRGRAGLVEGDRLDVRHLLLAGRGVEAGRGEAPDAALLVARRPRLEQQGGLR